LWHLADIGVGIEHVPSGGKADIPDQLADVCFCGQNTAQHKKGRRPKPSLSAFATIFASLVSPIDVSKFGLGDAKTLGDLAQKLHLAWMQHLVGLGDVEQAFQRVLE